MTSATDRIGIDLGGTKTEGILLSQDGQILERVRRSTPVDGYEATLRQIKSIVDTLDPERKLPVGIGTPGSVSRVSSRMRNANSTCLNGQPLQEDLVSVLGRDIRIANDADCFTLSEAADGAGKGAHIVFGVILGTGVGGGFCIDGKLLAGINGIAGEWGHNPLPAEVPGNRRCYCGRCNCVETWLSGPGLSSSYAEYCGEAKTAKEIAQLLEGGETAATKVFERYCQQLAAALAAVVNIIDPDVIVLGGGVSNIHQLYDSLPKYLALHVFSDHVATNIVRAVHGDSSGVRGAAWLWP